MTRRYYSSIICSAGYIGNAIYVRGARYRMTQYLALLVQDIGFQVQNNRAIRARNTPRRRYFALEMHCIIVIRLISVSLDLVLNGGTVHRFTLNLKRTLQFCRAG